MAPQTKYHDVTIIRKKKIAQARVMGVPPEEFGISRSARNIKDATYAFQDVIKREADLIADGYDADQVRGLPTYTMLTNPEELVRDTVDEHLGGMGDDGVLSDNRPLKITEHYLRMDYEKNGKPQLYRVVTGGDQGDILYQNGEQCIYPVDFMPFAAMTPVPITHRFFGRSIADLVMDIQKIKTALLRGLLDNTYMVTNPRTEVSEAHASDSTLDDLLVMRPGGIVRTKTPGGLNQLEIAPVADKIYPALQYMDATREWRTGVSRQGQGIDPNALQNQVATIATQMEEASAKKMKLIARIFAETGIRDMFSLLHATIRKHGGQAETVRLRNKWVEVDPREWKSRNDMTINVGLGYGNTPQKFAGQMAIINLQTQAVAAGKSNLVGDDQLWNSAADLAKILGHRNPERYFKRPDPNAPPPQQPPNPKLMEIQAKAQAEQDKVKADAAHQQMKTQADIAFQQKRLEFDLAKEQQKHNLDLQLAQQKHEMDMREHRVKMAESAVKLAGQVKAQDGDSGHHIEYVRQLYTPPEHLNKLNQIHQLAAHLAKPRKIVVVRDHTGKVSHAQSVVE